MRRPLARTLGAPVTCHRAPGASGSNPGAQPVSLPNLREPDGRTMRPGCRGVYALRSYKHSVAPPGLEEARQGRRAGLPVLVGPSRKGFVGHVVGRLPVDERLEGTLASVEWISSARTSCAPPCAAAASPTRSCAVRSRASAPAPAAPEDAPAFGGSRVRRQRSCPAPTDGSAPGWPRLASCSVAPASCQRRRATPHVMTWPTRLPVRWKRVASARCVSGVWPSSP